MPKQQKRSTRQAVSERFGGGLAQLAGTEPPTFRQIIQHSYFLQNVDENLSVLDLAEIIVKDILPFWKRVNPRLKLLKSNSLEKKVQRLLQNTQLINRKSLKRGPKKLLREQLDQVFWIAGCSCG